jgi:predicted DsbA family dithiol-disulfide isomerase
LVREYDLDVTTTFFPLHPDAPDEGILLEDLFKGRPFDVDGVQTRLESLMKAEGLPFTRNDRLYNSRLAQELGKWADSKGVGAIHDALYRANFVDGVNLAKIDELVRIAGEVGLDRDEARQVLEGRSFQAAVDADLKRARRIGVTGVPTFAAGARVVVGAQPYQALERLVVAAGAKRRA